MHGAYAAAQEFTDTKSHWAKQYVEWGVENGVTAGYEDGTFRPNNAVKEREFLAMVFRANPELDVQAPAAGEEWYEPYYTAAQLLDYPVSDKLAQQPYTRGHVARLIAATRGQQLSTNAAIQYLLDNGLSSGKTSATIEGYAGGDTLTRAEALTFIYNVMQAESPEPEEAPVEVAAAYTLSGIALGDAESKVIAQLGQPDRKDSTSSGYIWYIYNQDYRNYAQIGIADGTVAALYSNAEGWAGEAGIASGVSQAQLAERLDVPKSKLAVELFKYTDNDARITVYLDKHQSYKVEALLVERSGLPRATKPADDAAKAKLIEACERQLLDLANAFRVKHGAKPVAWDNTAAAAARSHSRDMAEQRYFDHTNLAGQEPWDRMTAAGIPDYLIAGENLAAGQDNALEAHHDWVNSDDGHRENMLDERYTLLGVGAAYDADSEYTWYYTQNFYAPFR